MRLRPGTLDLYLALSVMLATLNMFAAITVCFAFAATLIWLAPRPKGPIDTSGGH